MKKGLLFLFIGFTSTLFSQTTTSIDKIFYLNIQHNIISRGDNFPDFDAQQDGLDRLLFALHKGFSGFHKIQ